MVLVGIRTKFDWQVAESRRNFAVKQGYQCKTHSKYHREAKRSILSEAHHKHKSDIVRLHQRKGVQQGEDEASYLLH